MTEVVKTDYLVVGAGASGMAFVDALISSSDAEVVILDRRHGPGGHWNDTYPFIRLHQPSAYYGVNSTPLGNDAIDTDGVNAGMYERASGNELCAYYERVLNQLLTSGRVRFLPQVNYLGHSAFVSLLTGDRREVIARKAIVDARYLEPSVPATSEPPFEVAEGVHCVPVNELGRIQEPPDGYVIIGAGKTGADAILHLLENGVPPASIRWIKPREAWYLNRAFTQGGQLLGKLFDGLATQLEACAEADSTTTLFQRLGQTGQMLRVDDSTTPTMFRGPTISAAEVALLRQVDGAIRLGRVRRIETGTIHLEEGTIPTTAGTLHVHAAAGGLNPAPERPIFAPGEICLQSIRIGLAPFNSSLIGYVEATRSDLTTKNRLCPPNRQPDAPADWVRGTLTSLQADSMWAQEGDIAAWMGRSRVNIACGLRAQLSHPDVATNVTRYLASLEPAIANLRRLVGDSSEAPDGG